jgi:hypothetical protein
MTVKAQESRLWQKVKKNLTNCYLTRIESTDIHAVNPDHVFWIELKSDEANYPKLNKWPSRRGLLNCTDRCPVSLILVHWSRLPRSRSRYNGP